MQRSPSTAADDRALKVPFHAAAGVGHLWLLDSLRFTLEAHCREAQAWRLLGVWRGGALNPRPIEGRLDVPMGPGYGEADLRHVPVAIECRAP